MHVAADRYIDLRDGRMVRTPPGSAEPEARTHSSHPIPTLVVPRWVVGACTYRHPFLVTRPAVSTFSWRSVLVS